MSRSIHPSIHAAPWRHHTHAYKTIYIYRVNKNVGRMNSTVAPRPHGRTGHGVEAGPGSSLGRCTPSPKAPTPAPGENGRRGPCDGLSNRGRPRAGALSGVGGGGGRPPQAWRVACGAPPAAFFSSVCVRRVRTAPQPRPGRSPDTDAPPVPSPSTYIRTPYDTNTPHKTTAPTPNSGKSR